MNQENLRLSNIGKQRIINNRSAEDRFINQLINNESSTEISSISNIREINNNKAQSRVKITTNKKNEEALVQRYKRIFDTNKDGIVSDEEVLAYIIKQRKNRSQNGIEYLKNFNENANQILEYFNQVDSNKDGVISIEELVKEILKNDSDHIASDIKDLVLKTNILNTRIKEMINEVDSDGDKTISEIEALKLLMSLRAKEVANQDIQIANSIINQYENHEDLKTKVDFVDTNINGEISREEIYAVLRAFRQGIINEEKMEELMLIMSLNPNLAQIIEDFERYFPDANGDGEISPLDALVILNFINRNGEEIRPEDEAWDHRKDTNKDGIINIEDAQHVINYLNQHLRGTNTI
jgi:Ca2+-binding EF-hand superfamily protein